MSRTLSKYEKNKSILNTAAASRPPVKNNPPPALREVNLPASAGEGPGALVTAYKDLTQPERDRRSLQNRHLLMGVLIFVILGLGILMGRHFTGTRHLATADMAKLVPAGASAATSQHYHYDKTCYTGENGERVCMTRTSQR